MTKKLPIVLALAAAVAAGGCRRDTDQHPIASDTPSGASQAPPAASANERDQALVRVVNAVPDSPAVEVTAGKMSVASEVKYGSVTPYKPVPAANDDFVVKLAGKADAPVLAENNEQIMSGKHYTVIAFPGKEHDKVAVEVVTDDIVTPDPGKARVRVVHAAAGIDTVDVFAQGGTDEIFGGVDFRETTGYKEIDPSVTTLELKDTTGKNKTVARPNVSVEPGKSYTIVVTGRANGSPSLQAMVIEDRVVGQTATN